MVFAISDERSVLWEQFEYSGAPAEFSWVLPIQRGAYLEAAEQAWFDALDAATETSVITPELVCKSGSSRSGYARDSPPADAAAGSSYQGPASVQVADKRTVGPYEVTTLRSDAGDELFRWFDDHDYFVPEAVAPIIEAYVSEGADFIALKLRPGQGVQQMTPVRVITPGGEAILPFRMVAAGARDPVDIVLYVIGEHRYQMPDLVEVFVSDADLEWDFATDDSNYMRLRQRALAENGGSSYLTSFALSGAFADDGLRSMGTTSGRFVTSISDLYLAQAAETDEVEPPCLGVLSARLDTPRRIVEDGAKQTLPASGALACGGYTDLAAALVGLVPQQAWLTRLELKLPRTALAMDPILAPHDSPKPVSTFRTATKAENPPSGCERVGAADSTLVGPVHPGLVLCSIAAVFAAALCRCRVVG